MSATTLINPVATPGPSRRGTIALLSLASLIAFAFFALVALPYFLSSAHNADVYVGKRGPLLLHITGGAIALFAGPIQLWLGISDRRMDLHRRFGLLYMFGVAVGAGAAYWLAARPSSGWVFGSGLAALATAWVSTTALAFVAIRRSLVDQHKEWMIRSYVVTFAFVTFRVLDVMLEPLHLGTMQELFGFLAWSCWAVPLLVTELILQGRKVLAVSR
jgi:hypothetical protein